MMTNTATITITMQAARETKGTILFAEDERADGRRPRNFYVPKDDFAALGNPATITITISA